MMNVSPDPTVPQAVIKCPGKNCVEGERWVTGWHFGRCAVCKGLGKVRIVVEED